MDLRKIGLLTAILIIGATFVEHHLVGTPSLQAQSSAPEAVLHAARAIGVNNSDGHPSLAQYVVTSRQAAVTAGDGGTVDSNSSVYYIVMRGHFVDHNGRTAEATTNPTGNQLELTVDIRTGDVLDFALLHRPAPTNLAKIGPVHDITADVQQP